VDEDLVDARGFWERYSPNGELPWSSAMSLGVFTILVLLPIVLVVPFVQRDPTPPAVDVLYVAEDENAPLGEGTELDEDAAMGAEEEKPTEELPKEAPAEKIKKLEKPKPTVPVVKPEPGKEIEKEREAAEAALNRLAQAKNQLDANLNRGSPEGDRGGGGGGSGARGRGARVARWVLHFNTESSQHYLQQLDGLGAEIAFPAAGSRWQYFFDVSTPRRRSEIRDLGSENRLYWVDEKQQSVGGVAQVLGIPTPPFMIVFLPVPLEDRMLQLELDYQGLTEEQILRTDFRVVIRGGMYDVEVSRQLRR
jgi:hypothetical protein